MTPRCPNSLGTRGPCNERLRVAVQPGGVVQYRCLRCEARAAGRCWNCGKPRTNDLVRGLFCTPCGVASRRLSQQRSELAPERKRQRAAYDRARWRDPVKGPKKYAASKAWLAAHPEKVSDYKRRAWRCWLSKRQREALAS